MKVLIPSFSGLWLVPWFTMVSPTMTRLNPFFFRSLVGLAVTADDETFAGLNPFFFRSLVGPRTTRTTSPGFVLIPSFSGLWLVVAEGLQGQAHQGLNPFFFRSLVGHGSSAGVPR